MKVNNTTSRSHSAGSVSSHGCRSGTPLLAALSVCAVLASSSVPARANLLLNGDFNSTASWPAQGWTTWTWPNANNTWINRQNDSSSLDTTPYIAMGTGAGSGTSVGLYQTVPAIAGDLYTLSVDSGAQNWWAPEGEMRLFFLDASNTTVGNNTLVTVDPAAVAWGKGQPWANYSIHATAPAGTTQAKIEFVMNGGAVSAWGGGTVWFDNADLVGVPEPATFVPLLVVASVGLWIRRARKQKPAA